MSDPTVALITYSTKPRGGVVHTLALAEARYASGAAVLALRRPDLAEEEA